MRITSKGQVTIPQAVREETVGVSAVDGRSYILMLTIIGIPFGLMMVNRLPFVFSLHRGYACNLAIHHGYEVMTVFGV